MRRDSHGEAPASQNRFARHRTRLEEAEESELGREIRAREEEGDSAEDAGERELAEPSAEP